MSNRVVWAASIVLLMSSMPAEAQSLGRLFTTAAERAALNLKREALFEEQSLQELRIPDTPVVVEAQPQELGTVQLTGIVRRADGLHTVWLNGVPVDEADLPAHVRLLQQGDAAVLAVQVQGREFMLKPGQSLDAGQGIVRESFEVTPEQIIAIQAEVAARAERMRLRAARTVGSVADTGDSGDADSAEQDQVSEDEAMVQSVIEGLRILQEIQSVQEPQVTR